MKTTIPLKELVRDETDLKDNQLWIHCPVCKDKPEKENEIVRHPIYIPFAKVMKSGFKNKTGWNKTGDSIENLSVTPSVRVLEGCGFHGFITNGNVEYWID